MAVQSKPAEPQHARSYDHHVHLTIDGGPVGFANLEPYAHGIAAACEVAGKKVHMTYEGHDPAALGGAGFFVGVKLAVNPFTA